LTIISKKKKKPSGIAKGGKEISPKISKEQLKKMVSEIARTSKTYDEIMKEVEKQGQKITKPTIGKYLEEAWGDDYKKKRAEMNKRRALARKWKKDFKADRMKIADIFDKDYLSAGDGIYITKDNHLISMPAKAPLRPELDEAIVLDEEYYGQIINRNKVTFVKDGQFGYDDKDGKATFDPSIKSILIRQLKNKLKDDPERDRKLKEFDKQIDTMSDLRSDLLFGSNMRERKLCPAYASSDKTARGRTRMMAMEGIDPKTGKPYVFSRAVYNIPSLLNTPEKRIQVISHNIAKEHATLLSPEKPIVKAIKNDILGVNLLVRMPKNWQESLGTEESAVIISKEAAKKMRYFSVVEEGSIITDKIDKLPDTVRVDKKVKSHSDIKDYLIKALDISRGDPIIMNAVEGIEEGIGESSVSHSGKIILIGEPTEHIRNITVDPDKDLLGRNIREIRFFRQNYQIMREDELHRGDKLLVRGGIKSVVGDIVDDLGKDKQGRPYEMVVNYSDVWRKADPKDPNYELQEETFVLQGKKKASVVLEHEDTNGKMFVFIIDKLVQDEGTKLPMRVSTTFVGGLWEMVLGKVLDKERYTNAELNRATQRFVEHYIREPSTMIMALKSLHYRLVEIDDGKIEVQLDPNEPTEDKYGKIYSLRHEVDGKVYNNVYLPNFMSRLYRDVRTIRERFKISLDGTKVDQTAFQWGEIVRTIKNSMYIFPRIQESKELVAIPYVNVKDPTDINTIKMDSLDVAEAGGDPKDPNLKLSWRKEPITDKSSIQTARVLTDFSGVFRGTIGVHVESAKKAQLDFDGDQIVVFSPAIIPAMIKPTQKEKEYLTGLMSEDYSQKIFKNLYDEARRVKYADNEEELGIKCSKYNQTIAQTENRLIQELGGVRRSALLLFKSERPPKITIGEGSNKRVFEFTPALVNRVCDVEKVLKMREPYWQLQELYKKKWGKLTESERDLVVDMHVRREIKRMIRLAQKDPNVRKMGDLLRKEHAFMGDEGIKRERKVDPLGVIFDPKSGRLLDQMILHQIKISGLEVHSEGK
jgi:hypothetical protein